MIINRIRLITVAVLLATMTATTQAGQEQFAQSIRDAQAETAKTAEQLKNTLSSLNALVKQTKGDLRPAYDAFCAEVAKTHTAANVTEARVSWMQGDGRQYFQEWQRSVDAVSNESLRKKAQSRLNSVKTSYDKVETDLKTASDKFAPYLSDLSDIQKSLAADITPGGVKAVRSTVSTANWDHKFVDRAINTALKQMGKMAESLSTEVKQQ